MTCALQPVGLEGAWINDLKANTLEDGVFIGFPERSLADRQWVRPAGHNVAAHYVLLTPRNVAQPPA